MSKTKKFEKFFKENQILLRIGRLNFQSVQYTLKICSNCFWFRSRWYHAERIKLVKEWSGRFDKLTRFLHSERSS